MHEKFEIEVDMQKFTYVLSLYNIATYIDFNSGHQVFVSKW